MIKSLLVLIVLGLAVYGGVQMYEDYSPRDPKEITMSLTLFDSNGNLISADVDEYNKKTIRDVLKLNNPDNLNG